MNLVRFSVNNSLAVNLLSVLLLIAGVMVLFQIPREAFPNVNFGRVMVTTTYPGSTPREVEKLISIPLEDELREVDGIDEVVSISLEGLSMLAIKLDITLDEMASNKVVNDIQRAIDRVSDLPDEVDDPIVNELNTDDEPVLIISLAGPDIWRLRRVARDLEDEIEEMRGVSRVDKLGWKKTEIWVNVDPEKLAPYYLSFEDVAQALKAQNTNVPGGKVFVDGEQHVVRTLGEFETPEEIEGVIIRANDQGNWLTVGDVAEVHYALEDADRLDKMNGQLAVNLSVVKRREADTLELVDRLYDRIEEIQERIADDVTITTVEDLTLKYVRRRLRILVNNGTVGLVLVTLVLLAFLGWRVALLTAFGIPLSFCLTALFMWWQGITISLIAMFGLILVLGMLVDDAIVVAENCYRYMEKGMDPREAAIRGTSEVIRPVTATILTTVIFFSSLLFMTGIMGRFIWVIPAVVIVSLLASLFESIMILPSHIADFGKPRPGSVSAPNGRVSTRRWFPRLRSGYLKVLKQSLRWRWAVFFAAGVSSLVAIIIAVNVVKVSLFPARGVEVFYIRTESKTGTSLEQLEERMRPIERFISELPEHELGHFITTIGIHQDSPGDPQQRRGTHLGQIQVYLTTASDRKRDAKEIIDELRAQVEQLDTLQGIDVTFEAIRTGPPVGRSVEAHIRGQDFAVLEEIAEEFKAFLGTLPGVADIRDNYEPGKPEFQIIVDEQAARRARLGVADIGRAIRFAYEGIPVTTIRTTEEEINVRVRFPKASRHDLSSLKGVVIKNDRGDLIPLSRIATFVREPGVSYVTHRDFKRSITVSAGVDDEQITSLEANRRLTERFKDLPKRFPGYSVRYGGEHEETIESFQNFRVAFIFSLIACYVVLAIGFNSLIHPLVVISVLPFGLMGVAIAFLLHGLPLSFMTMLGTLGLFGVVLNDSIVLVTFILDQRKRGASTYRAILGAGKLRFRPVLLTTISTAVALAPVAYGIGGLDPFLQPAALAMTWGLVFATPLTLVVIPCIYAMELDVHTWLGKRRAPAPVTVPAPKIA